MAQIWTTNCYDLDDAGHLDLTNIEYNFACLRSMFSGGGAPSSTVAGMPWFSTIAKHLRIRNYTNDGWLEVLHGTVNQLCIFYRNSAEEGWVISTAQTDRVVGIKGGATYVTGGTLVGDWNMTGFWENTWHSHAQYHWHTILGIGEEGWHQHAVPAGSQAGTVGVGNLLVPCYHASEHDHTSGIDSNYLSTPSSITVVSDGSWRPAACVSTVQYVNV